MCLSKIKLDNGDLCDKVQIMYVKEKISGKYYVRILENNVLSDKVKVKKCHRELVKELVSKDFIEIKERKWVRKWVDPDEFNQKISQLEYRINELENVLRSNAKAISHNFCTLRSHDSLIAGQSLTIVEHDKLLKKLDIEVFCEVKKINE